MSTGQERRSRTGLIWALIALSAVPVLIARQLPSLLIPLLAVSGLFVAASVVLILRAPEE